MPPEPNTELPTEQSAVPPEDLFQYSPLPDGQDYIRLIHVQQWDDGQVVQCGVVEVPIEDAPPYEAISYTWGDPSQLAWIRVNGKRLQVRRNCEYVLRQSRWCGELGYIWIDAICINQCDTREKSSQVQLMGRIYKAAVRVLACIGPHADDSEYLVNFLGREHAEVCREDVMSEVVAMPKGRKKLFQAIPELQEPRLRQAFEHLSKRSYFRRVWTLQEIFLAREVRICCGRDHMLSALFSRYDPAIRYLVKEDAKRRVNDDKHVSRLFSEEDSSPQSDDEASCSSSDASLASTDYQSLQSPLAHDEDVELNAHRCLLWFANQYPPEPHRLYDLIAMTRGHTCEDPRDRLYGLLNMVDWKWTGVSPIPSDYTKSPAEFLEVLWNALSPSFSEYQDPWRSSIRRYVLDWFDPLDLHRELAAEIGRRSLANNTTSLPADQIQASLQKSRHWIEEARGLELVYIGGRWAVSKPHGINLGGFLGRLWSVLPEKSAVVTTHGDFERKHNDTAERYVLEQDSGTPAILLPRNVKSGDWLLFPRSESRLPSNKCILIARIDGAHGKWAHRLIGQAARLNDLQQHLERIESLDSLTEFRIAFDPKDLLVVETQGRLLYSFILEVGRSSQTSSKSQSKAKRAATRIRHEIVDTRPCHVGRSSLAWRVTE